MKRSLERLREWRRRSVRAREDRLREAGRKFRRIGSNPKRIQKLRAEQFGTDGYREHIISQPCVVCNWWPVDPAHVLGTRGARHGPEGLAPLCRRHHRAFDSSMTDERIMAVHGFLREEVREWARASWRAWTKRGGS